MLTGILGEKKDVANKWPNNHFYEVFRFCELCFVLMGVLGEKEDVANNRPEGE